MAASAKLPLPVFALLLGIHAAHGQSPASPADPLELRLRAAEIELSDPVTILHRSYRENLEKLSRTISAAGFPHRIALIQEELEGFAHDRIAPAGNFPELKRLQNIFDGEIAKLELRYTQNLKALFQRYRTEYREFGSRLQREGRSSAAAAANTNATRLATRLEDLKKQADSAARGPVARAGTRSHPACEFRSNGKTVANSEWKEGLAKDWVLAGPAPGIVDYWEMHLVGRLHAPAQGTYTLTGTADDRVLLTIDDHPFTELMVENPSQHDLGSIELSRGWHSFTLLFTEGTSGAIFEIQWSGPGFEARSIGPVELAGAAQPAGK